MSTETRINKSLLIRLLILASLALLAVAYFTPIWWVALKAPNYPPEAFPSGVRIHFHMNGIFNGCELLDIAEKFEEEALDCVHEMDAINHFVGMYPIASGGVVERAFSPFLMSLLGVLLIGFMIFNPKVRMAVMGAGFAGVAAWMYLTYYGDGGLRYQTAGYLDTMVVSLGQGHEEEGEELSPIIANLKESLDESGQSSQVTSGELRQSLERAGQAKLGAAIAKLHAGTGVGAKAKSLKEILAESKKKGEGGKAANIELLKNTFDADQVRKPVAERQEWTGSGGQLLFWHYEKALGRWFNNPAEIRPLVKIMETAGTLLFWSVLAGMVFLVFAARRNSGILYWLLVAVPIILPAAFIVEYASWLWWYGHSLNDMGAFTLKPFMPTVFGQGKVAQFSTYSYPHIGFGLFMASSLLLAVAALLRRKQLKESGE